MTLTDSMRAYLNGTVRGCEDIVRTMTTDQMRTMIETSYEGGYQAWRRDWTGSNGTEAGTTQVTLRAELKESIGRMPQLGGHEILHVHVLDEVTKVVSRAAMVRESTFRLTETSASIVMTTYCRYTGRRISRVSVPDAVHTYLSGHARVMTPERYVDAVDQYLTCYRPGTERRPMDGPEHDSRQRDDMSLWYQLVELGVEA